MHLFQEIFVLIILIIFQSTFGVGLLLFGTPTFLYFDYSFSIGSLEHFTEEGIDAFVDEAFRVTKIGSYHQVPTLMDGRVSGWVNLQQSFYNMPISWWKEKFKRKAETN